MAENVAPKTAPKDAAGRPFYEAQREHLKELIAKRRTLEKRITTTEESILQKETDYLENTPNGNMITGFDNYTKGTAGAARRKTGLNEANRVFSRSSISYNPNNEAQTPGSLSTPGASHAPTPLSSSFANKEGASAAGTPTSATASKGGAYKKKKSVAPVAGEDSETDTRETKKARVAFGPGRK